MSWPIVTVALEREADVVLARRRARRIAELLGFETQDQTRIATAVSEISRNAVTYAGGGRVEFLLVGAKPPQQLLIQIGDKGPGVTELDAVLAGRFRSPTGMGLGLVGARRLMDIFDVQSKPGVGTMVILGKTLPGRLPAVAPQALPDIVRLLAQENTGDPLVESQAQNRELLRTLAELQLRQDEAAHLNAELEETNRGVVALYAELDKKAEELQRLNANLEERVADAIAERMRTEEQLRQAQKMEAVGQLTGGVAHDFNNLLQIVTGNLEILLRNLPEDAGRLRRSADNAMRGAQRAAALTQRLLAFSRRQPLEPKPLEVNSLVSGMSDLLHRTLGEPIAIETVLAAGLWSVEADPNQLENAILNLAVNARHAMPGGGKLTIETTNTRLDERYVQQNVEAAPGQYVAICVTDTGTGMSKEVLTHVFEPFFTTKEAGVGSGLGLSQVYGFVKQSGGHVKVYSEPGNGTTVKIYLPRRLGKVQAQEAEVETSIPEGRAEELILVVEDDSDVRAYTVDVLRELGYGVLEAANGNAALRILEGRRDISLLFTDVVLPEGLNGRELADAAARIAPGMKILFTTGYARNAIVHEGRLDPGVQMIGKPFTYSDLATRVRHVLDWKLSPGERV